MSAAHPFTFAHYREILHAALAANYTFRLFDEPCAGRTVYLRHDIDNSIAEALKIAQIEAELGVRATYLVLLRSANYNPLNGAAIAMMREMASMGHAIGLHHSCEPEDKHPDAIDLAAAVAHDARVLGEALGREVRHFSFHNPAGKDEFRLPVPGLVNCYAAPYFSEIAYFSESNFRWRQGCPCEMFRAGNPAAMQLLIHPMTYCDRLASDRDAHLYFLYRKLQELNDVNARQNVTLRETGVTLGEIADYLRAREHTDG